MGVCQIKATATAKAVEIARHSGRMSDVEDFTQDVLCYLIERAGQYNSKRSQPKTFINMILTYAKKDLLRRMYRMKRRTIIKTVELHQTQAFDFVRMPELGREALLLMAWNATCDNLEYVPF